MVGDHWLTHSLWVILSGHAAIFVGVASAGASSCFGVAPVVVFTAIPTGSAAVAAYTATVVALLLILLLLFFCVSCL